METLIKTHKLIGLTAVALVAACVVQDARAMLTPYELAIARQIAEQGFKQPRDEEKGEHNSRVIKIPEREQLFGYDDRPHELECLEEIRAGHVPNVIKLLKTYGEWKHKNNHWVDSADLIRSQIFIEARTLEMSKAMIDAGIDPKDICHEGPAQFKGRSLIEIVKILMGDGSDAFQLLERYMCEKKLFKGFKDPQAYYAARKEQARNAELREQQEREEEERNRASNKRAANRRPVQVPIARPARVVAPAAQLDQDHMQSWSAYDRDHRGEDAQSAFKITRRGEDLEFSV